MSESWLEALPKSSHDTWFLLIQDEEVLDVTSDPSKLLWSLLEAKKDFQVFLGIMNEFDKYEVVGPCATYKHGPATAWRLTSRMDGNKRLVSITGTPGDCIGQRLGTLCKAGRFNDPVNYEYVLLAAE
jgi:hypothetical protein